MRLLITLLLILISIVSKAQFDPYLPNDTTKKSNEFTLKYDAETYITKARNSYLFGLFSASVGALLNRAYIIDYAENKKTNDLFRYGAYTMYGIALLAVINGSVNMEHYLDKKKEKVKLTLNNNGIGFAIQLN